MVNLPPDKCRICRGTGKLAAAVLDRSGMLHRYLPDVECDACNGTGKKVSAGGAAFNHQQQSQKQSCAFNYQQQSQKQS